jgi:crotonobetainyl-CoA:carnitine CoA-transferase CaiB-like acyl-CoA transferase
MDALVLDMSRLLPGPLATRILASLGFRVLRLMRPQGDLVESAAPELYNWLNSGKSTQLIDQKSASGRDHLLSLVKEASVLFESDLPGVMERLGVGHEVLRSANPGLVYIRIAGYRTPAERNLPGHDLTYLAASGLLPALGSAWRHLQIADLCGGLWAAIAALEGLRRGGGFYEVHLSDAFSAVNYPQPPILNGSAVCYNLYQCSEGAVALAALEPAGWERFCEAVAHSEWTPHAFSPAADDNPVYRQVCDLFLSRCSAEWEQFGRSNRLSLRAVQNHPSAVAMPPWSVTS